MTTEHAYRLLDRAVAYRPVIMPDTEPGHYLVQSEQDAGLYYRVNGTCDCAAGINGKPCKHRVAVAAIVRGVLNYGTWTVTR